MGALELNTIIEPMVSIINTVRNIKKSNGFLVVIADFIVEDFIAAASSFSPLKFGLKSS